MRGIKQEMLKDTEDQRRVHFTNDMKDRRAMEEVQRAAQQDLNESILQHGNGAVKAEEDKNERISRAGRNARK
jgi:hypothetical protein